jgi:hypothetical protein
LPAWAINTPTFALKKSPEMATMPTQYQKLTNQAAEVATSDRRQ